MLKEIIKNSEDYVFDLLRKESKPEKFYHSISHTLDVIKYSQLIGASEQLSEDDLEILYIAAAFHDLGYIYIDEGHEEKSAVMAEAFLKSQNYPQEKINKIKECILSTNVPQKPKTLIENILCDADLNHLGSKSFFEKNDLYRAELESKRDQSISEIGWLESTIKFVTSHKYFTNYAKENFEERKEKNIKRLKKQLKKKIEKGIEKLEDVQEQLAKDNNIKDKKGLGKGAERGVETMFRNVMRTHVEFSGMADNKANIMISVNTLVLTVIFAIMVRKLDTNPHLIIPTLLLIGFCLIALIFAVMVTRPNVTEGTFTKDDIHKKKANLLFFGNFFNMKLVDFEWGMLEMINDRNYLYSTMIKDFYYLGQVLGRKYKYLRICYNVFIFGFIISVIAYTIAIIYAPTPTQIGPFLD
ncbi:MAG: Pycsar system effector family protein [Melioribacteraceae bacterium]